MTENQMNGVMTRRRMLFIGAAFGACAAVKLLPAFAGARGETCVWRGIALGAGATIQLSDVPREHALRVFAQVEDEIRRLEAIFSLYQAGSALSRLNRDGRLAAPPVELVALLAMARAVHDETGGLFDPTVQPLFALYAEHFARPGANPRGPSRDRIEQALELTGFSSVRFDGTHISFTRPGMALTLNGIAQGYITDRIAGLLRAQGFSNLLLDIGEIRALGHGALGDGWRVGIRRDMDSDELSASVILRDQAIATSMIRGTVLDAGGRVGHIFHPAKGIVETRHARVSVVHASAARADALSTAAILMDEAGLAGLRAAGVMVIV